METKNIMIVGVGGQGTLLASRVLGHVLLAEGYDVKISEVHGMSQRGGSVVTYVRYGETVYSPIIDPGQVDLLLAFEQLEAYRWLPYLKADGRMVVNTQKLSPMPVITGSQKYPEGLPEKLKEACGGVILMDALSLAREAGNTKTANVVLLGRLAREMEISEEAWMTALREIVAPKFIQVNEKAFALGYQEN